MHIKQWLVVKMVFKFGTKGIFFDHLLRVYPNVEGIHPK
jgi:hypothetical protein